MLVVVVTATTSTRSSIIGQVVIVGDRVSTIIIAIIIAPIAAIIIARVIVTVVVDATIIVILSVILAFMTIAISMATNIAYRYDIKITKVRKLHGAITYKIVFMYHKVSLVSRSETHAWPRLLSTYPACSSHQTLIKWPL